MTKFKSKNKMILLGLIIIFLGLFSSNINASRFYNSDFTIDIDGKQIIFNNDLGYAEIKNGRTMIPVRLISESMGYQVEWNGKQKEVTISNEDLEIRFIEGAPDVYINDEKYIENKDGPNLNAEIYKKNDRNMVPLRFISELFGAKIRYKQIASTAMIKHFIYIGLNENNAPNETISDLHFYQEGFRQRRQEEVNQKIASQGRTSKIPILMYHHLLTEEDIIKYNHQNNSSILSLSDFKKQMDYLYENNFYSLSLEDLEDYVYRKKPLPKRSVLITFDDGYLSNAEYAYPIMKEYGFRGSIFMMGENSLRDPEDFTPQVIGKLSRDELYKYVDVFEYASHSYDMHRLLDGQSLLINSSTQDILKDISQQNALYNTKYIAYPYGNHNDRLLNLLKSKGYRLGLTVQRGYVETQDNPFKLNRFGIYPSTSFSSFQSIVDGNY